MWKVEPNKLCRKHLLGEHAEMHMFAGTIRAGKSVQGYLDKGLVELRAILPRHERLKAEMLKRGYRHASPLQAIPVQPNLGKVDVASNYRELRRRCSDCKNLAFVKEYRKDVEK